MTLPTFLFASTPAVAHTMNPVPFAQRLSQRGHRLLWYAGAAFHDRLAAVGATPLPYGEADDYSGVDLAEHFPGFAELQGLKAIQVGFTKAFVGQAPARVADLRRILATHEVDAMLCDQLMYGVGLASELDGVPWATYGDLPLPYFEPDTPPFGPGLLPMRGPLGRLRNWAITQGIRHVAFAEARRDYARTRRRLGLPAAAVDVFAAAVSPYLHLQGAVPSFDYPRRSLPGHMHWVGALRPDPPDRWDPPQWWSEVTGSTAPVVLVSQGSLRSDTTELVVPAVRGLADAPVLVVVTTGVADPADLERAYGGPLPANVRCAKFVPYDLLLPHVSCFVTNGGYTGVTLALAHGVPLVQAGTTEEKAEIGARIAWTGVGVRLGTTRPDAGAVRRGVDQVLTRPSYADAARRVQADMARHDAGTEGADLLEQLARTRQPVLRTPTPTG